MSVIGMLQQWTSDVEAAFRDGLDWCRSDHMAMTVFQATAGVVLMFVGFAGWPVIHAGKFQKRPMTRLEQCIAIGGFGTAVFVPAIFLIAGQLANVAELGRWGSAFNHDGSLVMMFFGGLFLYASLVVRRLSAGNSLHLKMFRVCTFAAGSVLLATNAYLISLRLA
jgi:hypothetical protein